MHFIFVACNKNKKLYRNDPSYIYRCENLGYALEQLGHTVLFTHLSSFVLKTNTDAVIFHRPSYSLKLLATVSYLKYKSVLSIYDVDDLIFNPQYAKESPAFRNNILSLKKVKRQFKNNLKALKLFSNFSVSTDPLAEHIRTLIPHGNIINLPNTVHHSWSSHQKEKTENKIKKLTYFPGTRSHDKDFETISKALTYFLRYHQDVKLYITGPLKFNLDVPSNQIVYKEKVPFSKHWQNYQNVWVNLSPLEETSFTQCKSALKTIEAAYWDVPTLCTPNSDTKRFTKTGAVIACSSEEWVTKLEMLYHSQTYKKITKNLRNNITKLADSKTIAQKFLNHIDKIISLKSKIIYTNTLFPTIIAKIQRKKGLYNCQTLLYYKKACLKKKNPETFVDYCMFRRDLGFILSKRKSDFLITLLDQLKRKHKRDAISLLREVSHRYRSDIFFYKENRLWLEAIYNHQESWRNSFKKELLKYKKSGICIVGNAATLEGSALGKTIDDHGLIIRFNQCWNEEMGNKDIGKKLDIWVSAPAFHGKTQSTAKWIIISGPDMIYREAGWHRFKDTINSNGYVLTVPLEIWKNLIFKLHSPPSAGVLILYWIKEIFGSWKSIYATGFDLNLSADNYHHSNPNHQPGKRHNWKKERDLLNVWKNEGLLFL